MTMSKSYALYLDDVRYPPHTGEHTGENWVLCRTVSGMLDVLHERGIPELASFDYELGRTDPTRTGYDALSCFLDFLVGNGSEGESFEVEVRLHTSSRYGANRMAQLLQERTAACEAVGIRVIV